MINPLHKIFQRSLIKEDPVIHQMEMLLARNNSIETTSPSTLRPVGTSIPVNHRYIIGITLEKLCRAIGSADRDAHFAQAIDHCFLLADRCNFSEDELEDVVYNLELAGNIIGGEIIRTKLRYWFYKR